MNYWDYHTGSTPFAVFALADPYPRVMYPCASPHQQLFIKIDIKILISLLKLRIMINAGMNGMPSHQKSSAILTNMGCLNAAVGPKMWHDNYHYPSGRNSKIF